MIQVLMDSHKLQKKGGKMRKLVVIMAFFCIVTSSYAVSLSADADGFAEGADISNAFDGLTLSSQGGYSGLDGVVYAYQDGLASTGGSVFGNNLSFERQWYADLSDGFALKADFEQPANYVSIDIIGDDYSGDVGVLKAYNSSDTLVDSVTSDVLDYGEVFTAEISRGDYDIAYIIAGGEPAGDYTVHLDNLNATVIPEPMTLAFFVSGGLILTALRRRK